MPGKKKTDNSVSRPDKKPERRLKPGWIAAAGFIVALAGYGFYWNFLSGQISTSVEQWAAERRADGYQVAYSSLRIGGFPFRLDVVMTDPEIVGPEMTAPGESGSWSWRGPALVMRIRPWRPSRAQVLAAGLHMVRTQKGARSVELFIDARELSLKLRFKRGALARAMVSVRDFLVRDGRDRDVIKAVAADVIVKRPENPGKPDPVNPPPAFDVLADILGLTYGLEPIRGLGSASKRIGIKALVTGNFPGVPVDDLLNAETMVQWRDSGGAVEIRSLEVRHGPLTLSGDGTLALDEGLQPIGSFALLVGGYEGALDGLVGAGVLKRRPTAYVKAALSVLAQSQNPGGKFEVKVPVSLQERKVFVGPFALTQVPYLSWP